jgi:hypothetical protein
LFLVLVISPFTYIYGETEKVPTIFVPLVEIGAK